MHEDESHDGDQQLSWTKRPGLPKPSFPSLPKISLPKLYQGAISGHFKPFSRGFELDRALAWTFKQHTTVTVALQTQALP